MFKIKREYINTQSKTKTKERLALQKALKVLGKEKIRNRYVEGELNARRDKDTGYYNYTVTRELKTGQKIQYTHTTLRNYLSINDLIRIRDGIKCQLKDLVRRGKSPKSSDSSKYVGIEIELIAPITRDKLIDGILEIGLENHISVHDDGSINARGMRDPDYENCGSCGGCENNDECSDPIPVEDSGSREHGHEICVLATQDEVPEVVTKLCDYLKKIDAYVNKSCGLHVHLDMRNRNLENAYSNLVASQKFLFAMQPKSSQENSYCLPVTGRKYKVHRTRYHAINSKAYAEHKTLEMRLHSGTVNAEKIINWVQLLATIADAPLFLRAPKTLDRFVTHLDLPSGLAEYVKARIEKFNPAVINPVEFGPMPLSAPIDGAIRFLESLADSADSESDELSEVA